MDVTDIELRMLGIIKETIGSDSKRTLKYAEALADIAAQARLSGSTPGVDGLNPAELRCAMIEQCAEAINNDRDIMARYARAARTMAIYEWIISGARFSVNPDGSISISVKRKD